MSQIHKAHCGNYVVPEVVRNGSCIDIGGNSGEFSLKFKNFFKSIHIYEPQNECYDIIKNRTKAMSHIELFQEAVYHTSDLVLTLISHFSHDSGSVALDTDIIIEKEWEKDTKVNECKTISLEDVLKRMGGKVDFMKMDCETSEYNFLMNKDLSNIKYMAIEIHHQIGEKNWHELINYILIFFNHKTPINNPTGSSLSYSVGRNKELFFESKKL